MPVLGVIRPMARYTEQDLERYERLIDDTRDRVLKQQAIVEQLTTSDRFGDACSVLDSLSEMLMLYDQERMHILEALTK